MKKYLMTGMAALAICAAFTSCSKDTDVYNSGVIENNDKQSIVNNYNEAFVKTFGQPAANHQWGFVNYAKSSTRANTYMNGNMEKYENAPTVGATEEADVEAYVHALTVLPAKAAPDWDTYFVTQIHEGKASYNTQKSIDNQVEYVAGNQMDELAFAMQAGAVIKDDGTLEGDWIHINNFNSANNTDWNGNTLVENGGTVDFAYKSTADSKYHNRWIGIDGADIDDKYKDYYYICFDFEATGDQYTSTVIKWRDANNTPLQANIPGGWTDLSQVMGKTFTYDDWSTGSKVEKTVTVGEEGTSSWELDNVVGGNKVVEGNNDFTDWIVRLYKAKSIGGVTPGGGSSSSSTSTRTDRIERRRLVSQGRIFCEDLGTDAARMTTSDIDFNDAVFDAKIWRLGQYDVTYVNGSYSSETDYLEGIYDNGLENGKFKYVAEIRLLAAGGTVPLKIGGNNGFEIHAKFGEGNNRTITHTTIINTMGAPSQANFTTTVSTETCDAVNVEVDITSLVAGKSEIGLDIIPIDVQWVSQTGQSVGELTADYGKAPQKLCVPIGTPWVYERIPITNAYKDFASYATSRTPKFWEGTNKDESLLYPSIPEGMTAETGETGDVNTNPYHDRVVTQGTTTTTTVTETVLWEGEFEFANASGGSNSEEFTLYSKDFAVGDKMRIYGEATGNDPWVSIHAVNNGSWINYAGCVVTSPYSDIVVTQDMIDKMTLKTALWGKFCKVTKICKVVTTTN